MVLLLHGHHGKPSVIESRSRGRTSYRNTGMHGQNRRASVHVHALSRGTRVAHRGHPISTLTATWPGAPSAPQPRRRPSPTDDASRPVHASAAAGTPPPPIAHLQAGGSSLLLSRVTASRSLHRRTPRHVARAPLPRPYLTPPCRGSSPLPLDNNNPIPVQIVAAEEIPQGPGPNPFPASSARIHFVLPSLSLVI
jgi:hypothetical protein